MNQNKITVDLPRRLLLATDLSARCDRALDRAAQLAKEWQAELLALNVLDPTSAPDQILAWADGADEESLREVARMQLARDLAGVEVRAAMRVARSGDAATAILEIAAEMGAGLVVTGVARNETLGRILLGSTVEQLARTLPQPLLVVRNRVRAPYRRIAVATDFSEASRAALAAALRLFPDRELILYHAHELPMSGLSSESGRQFQAEHGAVADTAKAFLAGSRESAWSAVRPVIELGKVELCLTRFVREHDIELVVMGAQGRSGIIDIVLGSTASRLLDWLPCDAMIVRQPLLTR
jgi:nucleotide-binding universal stress UspA family protein